MLTLAALHYFRDAALGGSVAAAARKHRISSSAVSQAIRGLERHFGAELLDHGRNRFALTDEGRRLLAQSDELIRVAAQLDEEMVAARAPDVGTIRLATQQSLAHSYLPEFMADFGRRYPGIKIHLRLATTNVVRGWLERREICMGLAVDNVDFDAFAAKTVREGEFVFVEAKAKPVSKNRRFLVPGATRETIQFRRAYEAVHDEAPDIAMEIDSWGVIKRFAQAGMGTGLVPDYLLNIDTIHQLRLVDLKLPPLKYRVSAYYPARRRDLSRASRIFLDELTSYSAKLKPVVR